MRNYSVFLLLFTLHMAKAHGCEPCGPSQTLTEYYQKATYVVMGQIIGQTPVSGTHINDRKGGETIVSVKRSLKGHIPMGKIYIRRFFGMCDYGISSEYLQSTANQMYLLFLGMHVVQIGKTPVHELYSCSPLLSIGDDNMVEFQEKLYYVDELQ